MDLVLSPSQRWRNPPHWQRTALCLTTACLLLGLAGGCSKNKSYNVASPVVGPAPPRLPLAQSAEVDPAESSAIQQVSFESDRPLPPTAVVARVNGHPILAAEIFEKYATNFRELEARMKAGGASEAIRNEQLRKAQTAILERDLPPLIEQTLMANAVRGKLKKEQLDSIEVQLDEAFEAYVAQMKDKFNAESIVELEAMLQQNGMSLDTMRQMFGSRTLAEEYMKARIGKDRVVTRQELVDEYHARQEEFAQPEQVKWQQLQISVAKHNSEADARRRMQEALTRLHQGQSFDAVVKEFSDGPLSENGGHWDWTQPKSVANTDVQNALSSLPVGKVSEVISSPTTLQIVRVTDRQEAGYTPFEDVQEDLRKSLIEGEREERGRKIIDELRSAAIVETVLDDGTNTASTLP